VGGSILDPDFLSTTEITMKTRSILATALLFTCLASSAFARDQGIINQANPLDCTMRFYMHPAHLYLSSEAPHSFGEHPAVAAKRSDAQVDGTAQPTTRPHPATLGRRGQSPKVAQTPREHLYP
jgi:hypothetical protein